MSKVFKKNDKRSESRQPNSDMIAIGEKNVDRTAHLSKIKNEYEGTFTKKIEENKVDKSHHLNVTIMKENVSMLSNTSQISSRNRYQGILGKKKQEKGSCNDLHDEEKSMNDETMEKRMNKIKK